MVKSVAPAYTGANMGPPTSSGLEVYFGLAYLFIVYARLTEFLASIIGTGLYLAMLTMGGALLLSALKGGVLTAVRSFPGVCWLALTAWYIICIPFAFWPGGSFANLKDMWIKSLLAFFVVAGSLSTIRQVRRGLFAMAGGILIVNAATIVLGSDAGGRLGVSSGSLANANGLAIHLMFGFPAILLLQQYTRGIFRAMSGVAIVSSAVAIFRTGSRSGLLMLSTLMAVVFFRASMMNKLKLILVSIVVAAAAITLTSEGALVRYLTMIDPSAAAQTEEGLSAIESRNARQHHFRQSLRMTLERPIFGVGPGNFASASAEDSTQAHEAAAWRNTHNVYTQVSSESGIPGITLFVIILVYCFRTSSRIYRQAQRRPEWSDIADIAFCFRLMILIYVVDGLFDSNAYLYHLPVFSALIFAFDMAVRREMPEPAALQHVRGGDRRPSVLTSAGVRGGVRPQVGNGRVIQSR
jgi:O-antigen ligase